MNEIKPTPGRIVHYHPRADEGLPFIGGQPLAAIIAAVHSDRMVNLTVLDANGHPHARQSVRLVQPADARSLTTGGYCEWMAYQIHAAGSR